MGRIVVHIGTHKTGTTSIQKTLSMNRLRRATFFFAFNFPWSYEENQRWIASLLPDEARPDILLTKGELCRSFEKREVSLLTITKKLDGVRQADAKRDIVIVGRSHPGESGSSYLIKGLVERLLMDGAFEPLIEQFVFRIVPMLNPDGVYRGYTRSNALGKMLNRCYLLPSAEEQPEVYHLDKLLALLSEKNSLEVFLDFHNNAQKEGLFVYGNSMEDFWVG